MAVGKNERISKGKNGSGKKNVGRKTLVSCTQGTKVARCTMATIGGPGSVEPEGGGPRSVELEHGSYHRPDHTYTSVVLVVGGVFLFLLFLFILYVVYRWYTGTPLPVPVPAQPVVAQVELVQCVPTCHFDPDRREGFGEECLVCLDAFTPGEILRIIPGCKHLIHDICLRDTAASFGLRCPFCYTDIIVDQVV